MAEDLSAVEKKLSAPAAADPKPAAPAAKAAPVAASPTKGKKGAQAPKKGVKSPKKGDALWTVRVDRALRERIQGVREIVAALGSRDPGSRLMAVVFLLSLVGMLSVAVITLQRFHALRAVHPSGLTQSEKEAAHIGEFLAKQAAEAKRKSSTLALGTFTVELKPMEGHRAPGVMNLAEMDIVIQCDSKETCEYIDGNQIQARNQVTDALTELDRDELLSHDGKRKLRRKLIDRLNGWLPDGQVEELYFSKLVVD